MMLDVRWKMEEVADTSEGGLSQVRAAFEQMLQNILDSNNCDEIEIRQLLLKALYVALHKQQTVACDVVGAQGTVLTGRLTLLVKHCHGGFVPDVVASTTEHHGPVQLLVIQEITLGHHPRLINRLAFDHHGSAMGIGSRVGSVILPMVFISKTN